MTAAITVDKLSKAYRIGLKDEVHDTLIGAFTDVLKTPWRNFRRLSRLNTFRHQDDAKDMFWALRDVSFEVAEGEVLGIIGRNGAGKSTLLKILSRITEPTSGRAMIHGRVSSLLEVGTGFHPELTGRDNVYMNGTILGMTKREIDHKFDEIVDFSGVEQFLDTPIKHFSSGMKVRLAFAVAAHLEPEILIIDEVLAVGDAEFQRKCLGKMRSVALGGRTVLFVSHNMAAISSLCSAGYVMEHGRVGDRLAPDVAIDQYFRQDSNRSTNGLLNGCTRVQGQGHLPVFQKLRLITSSRDVDVVPTCAAVTFEIELRGIQNNRRCECGVVITDYTGQRVLALQSRYHSGLVFDGANEMVLTCSVNSLPLVPGTYFVDLVLTAGNVLVECVERAARFEVIFADVFGTGWIPMTGQGHLVLACDWAQHTLLTAQK